MSRAMWASTVAVVLVGLGGLVAAQPPTAGGTWPPQGWRGGGQMAGMRGGAAQGGMMAPGPGLQMLKLTAEQRASIQKILVSHREQQQPQVEQVRQLHLKLNAAVLNGQVDVAKGLVQEIAAADAALLQARIDAQLQVSAVLTAEQRALAIDRGLVLPPGGPGGMRGGPAAAPPRRGMPPAGGVRRR